MTETGMEDVDLLEALLELASRGQLEVRVLAAAGLLRENAPTGSAACRVGERIWVVLVPDDPPRHQAEVLAAALGRYRAEFLEANYIAPGVRSFVDQMSV